MKASLAGAGYDSQLQTIDGQLQARLQIMDQAALPGQNREAADERYDSATLGPDPFRAIVTEIDTEQRARHQRAGAELRRFRLRAVPVGLGGAIAVLILLILEFLALRVSFHKIHILVGSIAAGEKGFHLLSVKLQQQREADAAALARRVHDELGQALTVIKLDANRAARLMNSQPERAVILLDTIQKTADETAQSARNISMELRPAILDQLGIVAALEWQLGELRSRTRTKFEFHYPSGENLPLAPEDQTAMFRVAQEAFTNVLRHSSAQRVDVTLSRQPHSVVLEISDDGVGIPESTIEAP
jgi:signal transduction histidine kinase